MATQDPSGAFDLILRNAQVIDPSQELNAVLDVGISGGKIAALERSLTPSSATVEKDLKGLYLCPGLIDLHGHWYGGSTFGIDPDYCLATGVTTAVDAGTTGFLNFEEFRRDRIEHAEVQLLAFLNISAIGIPTAMIGELLDLRYARPIETAATIARHSAVLLGVKVRIGARVTGERGVVALDQALQAADAANAPLMVHISHGAKTPEILRRLRPGDIITHCYQGRGDSIIESGAVIREALAARQDGVLFDVGHGCGSFRWATAKRAFEHFFLPDTISTDLHRFSVERWAIDMPTTMSKFLHLGMPLEDVILKSTWAPARAIGREDDLGTLRPGTTADVFVFAVEEGAFQLEDTHLQIEVASKKVVPKLIVRAGRLIEPGSRQVKLRDPYPWDDEVFQYIEDTA